MTITVRKAAERGRTNIDWLDSWHTFSFSHYHDPKWMHYRALRVINDDIVAAGGGFAPHPHRDMEIVTYILSGALEHKDSLGNGSVIKPGDVQRMSAGTGITHSEFNASKSEPVHLLQIWILPEKDGLKPGYEQKNFSREERTNTFKLVASQNGAQGSVTVHQDMRMYAAWLDTTWPVICDLKPYSHAWVHVATGWAKLNGIILQAGDSAAVEGVDSLEFTEGMDSEVLVFALA
jgi:redox-sensitive bicupin YhaK (pirin superfamily)